MPASIKDVGGVLSMTGPIFITGGARCGTELLRSILNRHEQIHICTETHYFDDPRPRLADPAQPSPAEVEALLDHFLKVAQHGYGLQSMHVSGPERQRLRQAWAEAGEGADALFAAHCAGQAVHSGKAIWGEKTPRHLFRAAEIFGAFPDAKMLICKRDPRAAVISYRDWRNNWFDRSQLDEASLAAVEAEERRTSNSYNLTVITLLWRSAVLAAERALADFGPERVYIHRYEDLIAAPEATIEKLTEWLGLPYAKELLDVGVVNSSYAGAGRKSGVQQAVAERWRSKITPHESAYIEWLVRLSCRPPASTMGFCGKAAMRSAFGSDPHSVQQPPAYWQFAPIPDRAPCQSALNGRRKEACHVCGPHQCC